MYFLTLKKKKNNAPGPLLYLDLISNKMNYAKVYWELT